VIDDDDSYKGMKIVRPITEIVYKTFARSSPTLIKSNKHNLFISQSSSAHYTSIQYNMQYRIRQMYAT